MLGNLDGILVAHLGVDRHLHLLAESLQLADGSGTVDVACHEHDALALLSLEVVGEFSAEGGLTGTLQTSDEDDGGLALDVDFDGFAAHELCQLLVDNLHHQLARLDALDDVAAQGLGLHLVGELLGDGIAHVGVEKGLADLLDGLRHVDIGD